MASNLRIINETNGFQYKRTVALGLIEECVLEWVREGFTVRTLAQEERNARRAAKARRELLSSEILGLRAEVDPQIRFEPPASTNYVVPREAYEELEAPIGVRLCNWPRKSANQLVTA